MILEKGKGLYNHITFYLGVARDEIGILTAPIQIILMLFTFLKVYDISFSGIEVILFSVFFLFALYVVGRLVIKLGIYQGRMELTYNNSPTIMEIRDNLRKQQ